MPDNTCGVCNIAPKDLGLNSLNFREGNEESSEEARAQKARVYAEFDDCPRTEKFVKLLEFRHFERHIVFSQSDRACSGALVTKIIRR